MHRRIALLLFILVLGGTLWADDFATNFPPVVTYTESYVGNVQNDGFGGYQEGYSSKLTISVKCSMKGVDLSTIDGFAEVTLNVGDFAFDDILLDSDDYMDGDTSATWTLTDSYGDPTGTLKVSWNQTQLLIGVTITNDEDDYEVEAAGIIGGAPSDTEPATAYSDEPTVDLTFGNSTLETRTLYVSGTVAYKEDDRVSDTLSTIHLTGTIDSTPPTNVVITDPPSGSTVFASPYTIHGTATDNLGGVGSVAVRINGGPFQPAHVDSPTTWTLAGAVFTPGKNTLVVEASDVDGNLRIMKPVVISYSTKSTLTVEAAGDRPGKVKSPLFKTISYVPNMLSPLGVATVESGTIVQVSAVAAPGAIFAGWTSSAGALPKANCANLTFTMSPNLILTAHFIPNPFIPLRGAYNGLIQTASGYGMFQVTLNPSGQFTGTIRNGPLTLPITGTFGADEKFTNTFTKKGVTYTVSLQIGDTGVNGAGQITGTIDGSDSSSATVSADMAAFKKNVRLLDPADLGNFNVLLPADSQNTDPNFPIGIGYGRVSVSSLGVVRFVGKLGDGVPLSTGSVLSQAHVWPFYAGLYKRRGFVGGPITLDISQPNSDLAGTLKWGRAAQTPVTAKPYSAGFSGSLQVTGAKWTPPTFQVAFLNPSNGAGIASIDAPSVPSAGVGTLKLDFAALVTTSNAITVSLGDGFYIPQMNISVAPSTGLLKGSFLDNSRQSHAISGIVVSTPGNAPKVNAAGGFFPWGGLTGSVQVTAGP